MLPIGVLARPRTRHVNDEFNGTALRKEWLVTDPENHFAVGGGGLAFAPFSTPTTWDVIRLSGAKRLPPLSGLTAEFAVTFTAFGATTQDTISFGMDVTQPVVTLVRPGFTVSQTGQLNVLPLVGSTVVATPVTLALNQEYRFRVQFLPSGCAHLFSADRGKTWQVLWGDTAAQDFTKLYCLGVNTRSATGTFWYARWYRGPALVPALSDAFAARTAPGRADTGQPWLVPNGKPLPAIAGDLRIAAGQTEAWLIGWDGIADGVWEGDLNFGSAPSTQKVAYLVFRQRDQSNYTRVTFNRAGQQIAIVRVAFNGATAIATLTGAGFADNTTYRMRVACYGSVIVVYQDGAEKLRTAEPFGQFFGLCSWYLNDNLATPDIRWANVRAWGFPPPPLLADSFDRPDSVLSLGTADSGQAYIPFTDVANVPGFGIESGRAQMLSTGGPGSNDRMARAALTRASYLCWAILRTKVVGSGFGGVMLRALDSQNWVALRLQFSGATNFLGIFKDVAGVRSSVSNIGLGGQLPADTDQLVAVAVTGNVFEYWLNGVRQSAPTVTDHAASPAGGLYVASGIDPRIDDLRYVPLGTALVHDTFTRADSALTLGNTELPGTPWVPVFGGVWGINSNQAYNVDITPGRGVVLPVLVPDLDVSCDMVHQTGVVGLLLRVGGVSPGNDYLLVQFDGTNCTIKDRVAAGTILTLANPAYAWAFSATARNVRARLFQGVLSVYVNEALIVAQPFSGHAGPTEINYGLYASQSSVNTNRFDNFLVREVVV